MVLSLKSNIISHRQEDAIFHGVGSQCQLAWPDIAAKMQFLCFYQNLSPPAPALPPPLCWCKHLCGHMVSQIREQIKIKTKCAFGGFLCVCFSGLFFSWIPLRIRLPMCLCRCSCQNKKQGSGQEEAVSIGWNCISRASYLKAHMKLWPHSLASCTWFPHFWMRTQLFTLHCFI